MSDDNSSWIRYIPHGGADDVTGSAHEFVLDTQDGDMHYLVDAGMFAGQKGRKFNTNIAHLVKKLCAIVVTHAHVDHIGRLPYLYRLGYRCPIYATEAVIDLASKVLPDAGKIQEENYKFFLQKSGIRNKTILDEAGIEPLYTAKDGADTVGLFESVCRGKTIKVDKYLEVYFYNAGHALGSSSILLTFNNGKGETYRVLYAGDIGQNNPILKQRKDIFKKNIDLVLMESTYAGREHCSRKESWNEFRETAATAIVKGGNVVIPAFAVGRTQEILYLYYEDMMKNNDWVAEVFRRTPVFVDSLLAVSATEIFRRHPEEFKASAFRAMKNKSNNPFNFPQLSFCPDVDDSKRLTQEKNNYVVFTAAGMCTAGRVLYHLEKDLPNPNSAVIIPGYQAEGTLGRQLVEGARQVKIHGETINVRAKIVNATGFSAHADQEELKKWLTHIEKGYVLGLVHGEPESQKVLKDSIVEDGIVDEEKIELVAYGKVYYLYKGGYRITTYSIEPDSSIKNLRPHEAVKKKEVCMMEHIRDVVQSILDDPYDYESLQILSALERELNAELKKMKFKRRQGKPNKRYMTKKKLPEGAI